MIILDLARYSWNAEIPGGSGASSFARWISEYPKRKISRDVGKGEKDQRIVRSRKKRGVELVEHATIPEDLPEVMRPVSCPREPKRCATNHEIKVYDIGGMGQRLGHGRGDVEAMEGVAGCREV